MSDMQYYVEMDIDVLSVERAYAGSLTSEQTISVQKRKTSGLVWYKGGEATLTFTDGRREYLRKNSIYYFTKNEGYTIVITSEEPLQFNVIDFQLHNESDNIQVGGEYHFQPHSIEQYQSLFLKSERYWARRAPMYKVACKSLLLDVLRKLLVEKVLSNFPEAKIQKVTTGIRYMEEHYCEPDLSIKRVAQETGMSETQFRRLFEEMYSVTPLTYLIDMRINNAKNLISSGAYTMGEVAEKTGFANIYYFSRVFKRHTGAPPSMFKE